MCSKLVRARACVCERMIFVFVYGIIIGIVMQNGHLGELLRCSCVCVRVCVLPVFGWVAGWPGESDRGDTRK